MSEFPEKAIGDLNKAIDYLMKIVSGAVSATSDEFDPDAVIANLEAMLKPVLSALYSLPVPEIPGLA